MDEHRAPSAGSAGTAKTTTPDDESAPKDKKCRRCRRMYADHTLIGHTLYCKICAELKWADVSALGDGFQFGV